jgi:serine protease inhibitor
VPGGGGGAGASTTGEQVLLANSIWSRKGVPLKKSYVDAMKTTFQVGEGACGGEA